VLSTGSQTTTYGKDEMFVVKREFGLKEIMVPVIFLTAVAVFLLFERIGLTHTVNEHTMQYLPEHLAATKIDIKHLEKECMILTDSGDVYSNVFLGNMEYLLDTISVGYDVVDIATESFPNLAPYQTVVCTFPNFDVPGPAIFDLVDWVNEGGQVFFYNPPTPASGLQVIGNWLGIIEGGNSYSATTGLTVLTDFMIGSKEMEYSWETPILTLDVQVSTDSIVHIKSNTGTPLLWERGYGKGKFVVNTLPSTQKAFRGVAVAAYSLLYDAFAYPVINASTIFIDDFPSPMPTGFNEFITKDFNRSIGSFFSNVWWPDMMNLSKKYGLKYTGLIIESYSDKTEPPFERNTDTSGYVFFGSMLLNSGGQIGCQGYNHQPLCFDGFDYKGRQAYNTWQSEQHVLEAVDELISFSDSLFPGAQLDVYAPPSNILSAEGRRLLAQHYPQFKTYSGIYIKQDYEYEQEFCIDEYGAVNVPRIISGTLLNAYDRWLSFNELNYHYVNSYYLLPNDVLDPARGAEIGWLAMLERLEDYIAWVYDTAPGIRNLNASDTAKAVQRYDTIRLRRSRPENTLILEIENFYDEAFCIVRIRDNVPGLVIGGVLEKISGELYLLKANSAKVEIEIAR
jgi:hypothetical protein